MVVSGKDDSVTVREKGLDFQWERNLMTQWERT